MLPDQPIAAGQPATWMNNCPRFRNQNRCYHPTVRVLKVRKRTAWIEAMRYDNTTVRRFVKLDRLLPGARWR